MMCILFLWCFCLWLFVVYVDQMPTDYRFAKFGDFIMLPIILFAIAPLIPFLLLLGLGVWVFNIPIGMAKK